MGAKFAGAGSSVSLGGRSTDLWDRCEVSVIPPAGAEPTGPPLTVPQDVLDQSVHCTPDLTPTSGEKAVSLLAGGVGFDPADAWSWGYAKALPRAGSACAS